MGKDKRELLLCFVADEEERRFVFVCVSSRRRRMFLFPFCTRQWWWRWQSIRVIEFYTKKDTHVPIPIPQTPNQYLYAHTSKVDVDVVGSFCSSICHAFCPESTRDGSIQTCLCRSIEDFLLFSLSSARTHAIAAGATAYRMTKAKSLHPSSKLESVECCFADAAVCKMIRRDIKAVFDPDRKSVV